MKITAFTSAVFIAACVLGAGFASAQAPAPADPWPHPPGPPPRAPSFEDLDANHDGVVSKAEFDAWRAAHPMPEEGRHFDRHYGRDGGPGQPIDFAAMDTDHDGRISWAEFQAAVIAHLKDHFGRLDVNHDGFIEKDELPPPVK